VLCEDRAGDYVPAKKKKTIEEGKGEKGTHGMREKEKDKVRRRLKGVPIKLFIRTGEKNLPMMQVVAKEGGGRGKRQKEIVYVEDKRRGGRTLRKRGVNGIH